MANNNYISIPNPQDESVVIYRSEDATVTLDVQLADETVWLTQKQMAWLFDRTPQNITIHLGNVYKEKLTSSTGRRIIGTGQMIR